MKKLLIAISLFALFSCEDSGYYPRVIERVFIENKTSDTLFVRCDSIIENPFFLDSIAPGYTAGHSIENYSYDLWMSADQLEDYFSHINIFKIAETGDTVFLNRAFYDRISDWQHSTYSVWDWDEMKINDHVFTVDSVMFNP